MGKHKNYNIDVIKYYYENTYLTINQISQKTAISTDMIRYYIRKYHFTRNDELKELEKNATIQRRIESRLNKNNGKYFSDNSLQQAKNTRYRKNNGKYFSEETSIKRKETNLNKYGVENPFQLEQFKNKAKQTKLLKYNNDKYNNRKKAVNTRLKNNNNIYYTDEIRKKSIKTNLNKYGVTHYSKTDEYKIKSKQTRYNKNNGNYFSKDTINKLKIIAKENYKKSNIRRVKTLKNNYKTYNRCFYNNEKLLYILEQPDIRFIEYINQLDENNKTFSYIENDLNISYTSLLNYSHKYNFKDMLKNTRSHFQQDVLNFIKTLNVEYIENNRTIIKPLEIDIYIPKYNVGIECNGNYWHSCKNASKDIHHKKSVMCEEKGIRLIHIFEYEWENERQKPILKNIIKNALNENPNRIYARKLSIEIRKSSDMKDFFNKNNIQGFRGGKFAICLIDKSTGKYDLFGKYIEGTGKVYMSYMMGKAFFGKGKYEWEVIRGATELGYTVVGGASKIWRYFIKNYKPESIVYYIDYNYFNGNSLPYLGLQYIKTQPSFKNYFVKTNIVKNRDPMHHKEIIEGYKNNEIYQIYNAGTKVYVWEKEKEI